MRGLPCAKIRRVKQLIVTLRTHRPLHLAVANLRILLGFAFLPAGLKKVLYQPFTDPQNSGPFHDFLHGFYATGFFYQFVGGVQLLVAVLLMSQTFATLGSLMALPVITCILVFCWSTWVVPTAIVTTLMFAGTLALVLWDIDRWLGVVHPDHVPTRPDTTTPSLIDLRLWRACGLGILVVYALGCLAYGGVYRPKGMDLGEPAFYVLPLIVLFPIVTLVVEQRRRGRSASGA